MTAILINPYALAPVAPAVTREYRALKSASDQSAATLTVSACDIGTATVGRYVFALFFFAVDGADRTVVSATIGGVAATVHTQQNASYFTGRYYVVLLSAPLDSGTTADVSITLNSSIACSLIRCATYKVVAMQSNTPVATVATGSTSSTISVQDDGVMIGGVFCRNGGADLVASGWAEDFESAVTGSFKIFGASKEITATTASFAFSTANGGSSGGHAMIAGSFR